MNVKQLLALEYAARISRYVAYALLYALILTWALHGLIRDAEAKSVTYGDAIEQVRINHGGPTIFRFPKAVQTITGASRLEIKPANAADPSYTVLAVTPRFTNGENDVSFFLVDGAVIRTRIIVSPKDAAADTLYDFKSKDAVEAADGENAPPLTEVELLKAMVRDGEVSGYKLIRREDATPEKMAGVSIDLLRIYRGSPFNGYVYRLTNTSSKAVQIDVRHVTVGEPNLAVLSQSDEGELLPKGKGPFQTMLRIVAKNTSSSRDVIFALEPEEKKKGE